MPATTSVPFTLRVEDLGRLVEAEVELRPMTLFVGENNSGKSYLATLLWTALRPQQFSEFQSDPQDPDWLEACKAARVLVDDSLVRARRGELGVDQKSRPIGGSRRSKTRKSAEIHAETVPSEAAFAYSADLSGDDRWVTWAVRLVERQMPGRLRSVLGASHIQPKVQIGDMGWVPPSVVIQVDVGRDSDGAFAQLGSHGVLLNVGRDPRVAAEFLAQIILLGVVSRSLWDSLPSIDDPHGALFFPASRTAFVQNLPELTDRQLERSFQNVSKRTSQLIAPVRQFLRFLVNPGEIHADEQGLSSMIEDGIIGGNFQRGPGIDYQYTPAGLATPLPMHLTSSVVTELLPLWLLVSTGRRPPLLVYEEPEAHLHPRLQRVVAVVLARLARQGTKVLVTTHSETFAQQINNLIKRGGLDREARDATAGGFPYMADDYLTPDDVAGYEFRFRDDGRSYTERLEVRPDGIVMPMFNKELLLLTDEAIRLDEALTMKQDRG